MRLQRGFTIFEMVTVLVIIILLISVLLPSLGRARRTANDQMCGVRLGQISIAARTYAAGHDRHYPHRAVFDKLGVEPTTVQLPGGPDDRPLFRRMLSNLNKTLSEPNNKLNRGFDFPAPQAKIEVDYALWFGFGYGPDNGVYKVNDRLRWTDPRTGFTHRFAVLASDIYWYDGTRDYEIASHEDQDRVLTGKVEYWEDPRGGTANWNYDVEAPSPPSAGVDRPEVRTEEESDDELPPESAAKPPLPSRVFYRWESMTVGRGRYDVLRFAMDDGSVQALSNVLPDDPRLGALPSHADPTLAPNQWAYLPRQ